MNGKYAGAHGEAQRTSAKQSSSEEAEAFYADVLHRLKELDLPFLLGGGFAVSIYTAVPRPIKDLDVFTTAGDFPRILAAFQPSYEVMIEDERWIAKLLNGDYFVDVIFGSANGAVPVTAQWFEHATESNVLGVTVPVLNPTELVWSKIFIRDRKRFDGADVVNLILTQHDCIDWTRLLAHMDAHWEVLLAQLLEFRWAYPSGRDRVPRWLLDELLQRLKRQLELPSPERKVCRGRIFSRPDYQHAVDDWGFADIGGEERRNA